MLCAAAWVCRSGDRPVEGQAGRTPHTAAPRVKALGKTAVLKKILLQPIELAVEKIAGLVGSGVLGDFIALLGQRQYLAARVPVPG